MFVASWGSWYGQGPNQVAKKFSTRTWLVKSLSETLLLSTSVNVKSAAVSKFSSGPVEESFEQEGWRRMSIARMLSFFIGVYLFLRLFDIYSITSLLLNFCTFLQENGKWSEANDTNRHWVIKPLGYWVIRSLALRCHFRQQQKFIFVILSN